MYIGPWMQAALLPRTWDVCGVIVPPLSVWHVYILRRSGNSYITYETMPDMDSAAELLMYASLDIAGARRLYTDPKFRAKRMRTIHKKLRRMNWDDVEAACFEYVRACMRTPGHREVVSSNKAGGKPKSVKASAPTEWILAECISGGDPAKMDDAFNSQYSVAVCMFDARRNVSGDDDTLISDSEEEKLDKRLARANGSDCTT